MKKKIRFSSNRLKNRQRKVIIERRKNRLVNAGLACDVVRIRMHMPDNLFLMPIFIQDSVFVFTFKK